MSAPQSSNTQATSAGDVLPIEGVVPDLVTALRSRGVAVLQAPPGAGKTTRVPLALLEADLFEGKLLMLEPRRLATRAAAERLASQLGEPLGQRVGYAMRGARVSSPATRIEVITEGVLTRMLQRDPELPGIGAVIFDEFHERALVADLGLALTWEVREALRPDLKILVMSATLDAGPVADMLGKAPVVTSEGRSFEVTTHFLDRPRRKEARLEADVADLVIQAHAKHEGGILVFLPGEGEIKRTRSVIQNRLTSDTDLHALYGAMPFEAQRAAISPSKPERRKVVLATSIAETSLTIEDIRVVVDSGLARRAVFDPNSGMSRLITERVSQAEATQRAGRAGRVAEGHAYRLWTKGEAGSLAQFAPPEILSTDLTALALDLAAWGSDPKDLAFLTPPPPGTLKEARSLLAQLGALKNGQVTDHGRQLMKMPLHPRLAHMLRMAGPVAAPIAALLSARAGGRDLSLAKRLRLLSQEPKSPVARDAKRLLKYAGTNTNLSAEEALALAYPDRIGKRRKGPAPRYLLSGGKGAVLPLGDDFPASDFLVAADLDGDPREAKIRLAVPLTESQVRAVSKPEWEDVAQWDSREARVIAVKSERLGAISLQEKPWRDAPAALLVKAMLDGVAELGLPFDDKSRLLQARIEAGRRGGLDLPDVSDEHLLETRVDWLAPFLDGITTGVALKTLNLRPALEALLGWDKMQALDKAAPSHFVTPLGHKAAITYAETGPEISLRLQELYGQTSHPTVAGQALKLILLSPARRPIQVTRDLPGFWAGSYKDVRKDMRAEYPKHPWPEDPTQADPTLRAKPRKRT